MTSEIETAKVTPKVKKDNHKKDKLVAIAIPVTNRTNITAQEQISLDHLLHFLGDYDKYFIAPDGLNISHPEISNKYFGHEYFGSGEAHSRLLLSNTFYESFLDYEYLMICHLDTLIFSDQLTEWCHAGYDYIAPPWIEHDDAPYAGQPDFEGKIGNGGFSLRKVDSFLKVINSNEYFRDPEEFWEIFCRNKSALEKLLNLPRKLMYRIPRFNNAKIEISRKITIEDMFWANRGPHYYPGFKLAPIDVALKFAFESLPRYCYEQNGNELPFGCHAWEVYDKAFWEPFLLPASVQPHD